MKLADGYGVLPFSAPIRFVDEPLSGSPDPDGDRNTEPIYIDQIYALRDYGRTTLFVDFSHVLRYEEVLARAISEQYYR